MQKLIAETQPKEVWTESAIIDRLVEIFTETKREQSFFKTKNVYPSDFYYYTFTACLFNGETLPIFQNDVMEVMPHLENHDMKTYLAVFQRAIIAYLEREGQCDLVNKKVNSGLFKWRLI